MGPIPTWQTYGDCYYCRSPWGVSGHWRSDSFIYLRTETRPPSATSRTGFKILNSISFIGYHHPRHFVFCSATCQHVEGKPWNERDWRLFASWWSCNKPAAWQPKWHWSHKQGTWKHAVLPARLQTASDDRSVRQIQGRQYLCWYGSLPLDRICLCLFLTNLEIPIVTTALIGITDELGGFNKASWVISAYLLGYVGEFTSKPWEDCLEGNADWFRLLKAF